MYFIYNLYPEITKVDYELKSIIQKMKNIDFVNVFPPRLILNLILTYIGSNLNKMMKPSSTRLKSKPALVALFVYYMLSS